MLIKPYFYLSLFRFKFIPSTDTAGQFVYFVVMVTFFLSMLKLSMMTPMKRLRVKKAPTMMKMTKNQYQWKPFM